MIETVLWIAIAFVAAIWFFSLLEGWADLEPIDDNEPEDP